jgi:hypothetical protein
MANKWIGLSDREAFTDIFIAVRDTVKYAHQQRGHTTDEDLVEKLIWKLEGIIGYEEEDRE